MSETVTEHLLTFAEAEKVNAYKLATQWADHDHFPVRAKCEESEGLGWHVRSVESELEELATIVALRTWLERWTPLQIHIALLSGATIDQVAAAAGATPNEVASTWRAWDTNQRSLWQRFPDLAKTAEHDQVAAVLATAAT